MRKRIIFVTDLTLWSMGKGNGGLAFTQTIKKYIDEGCDVWLVSDVESNRNFDLLPNERNIILRESKYKKNVFKRHIGFIYRILDHVSTTRKYVDAIERIILTKESEYKDTILYAYEIFGVEACKIVSRHYRIPFVTRFQGTILSQYRDTTFNRLRLYPHFQAVSQKANAVIMTDDGTQGDMVLEELHNKSEKIIFWRNGLDLLERDVDDLTSQFDRKAFRHLISSRISEDTIVFLTVSRLVQWKHVDRAIRGFASYINNGGKGSLIVVGEGNERDSLELLAKSLGVSEMVFFVGAVIHEDVYKYMMACDVFLSLYDLSNVGNPLLEAMTLGKCIVTLNVGDTGKVITNRKNGILLDTAEICNLKEVLNEVANDVVLREALGRSAASYAKNNFYTWERRMDMEYAIVSKLQIIPEFSGGGYK